MALTAQIYQLMTGALKAGDKPRLEALRYLVAQIKNKEIDLRRPATDPEVVRLLQFEAKKRREAIEAYEQGGRQDLVERERYQLGVIEEFLPKKLTDDELQAVVIQVKASHPGADFGTLMKLVLAEAAGRADGGRVAEVVKASLGG